MHKSAVVLAACGVVACSSFGTEQVGEEIRDGGSSGTIGADGGAPEGAPTKPRYEVVMLADRVTWDDARSAAQMRGGHLATISSAAENDAIRATIAATANATEDVLGDGYVYGPWIGASQASNQSPAAGWGWVTSEPFTFMDWARGEPNDADGTDENRATFFAATRTVPLRWGDVPASFALRSFVVEYED